MTPLESKACMLPRLIVDPNLKLESSPPSAPSSASKDSYKVTECAMCYLSCVMCYVPCVICHVFCGIHGRDVVRLC